MTTGDAAQQWDRAALELIGRVIGGKYRIDRVLGRGGMGTIYVEEQQPLGRSVALKVLHPTLGDATDPEFQKRFLLEAATLSKLAHPNIVVVHDYGGLEGDAAACFMVMELLEGRTVHQALSDDGPFSPERALRVVRDVARALRAAHALGVVHRDLKPSNVMLCHSADGEAVKVLDFGLVKVLRDDCEELTAEGRFLGSPRYMSPEQIQRLPMDGRSDLYSLGILFYRMLTGEVPFVGEHAVQTLMAHLAKPVPRFAERGVHHVPPELEAIVRRLLEKNPNDRYVDAEELIRALHAVWGKVTDEPLAASGAHAVVRASATSDPHSHSHSHSISGSAPRAAEGSYALPAPAARRWLVPAVLGAALVLGVLGAFVVLMVLPPRQPAVHETVIGDRPPRVEPPEPPAAPPPAPAAGARSFTLTLETTPPGATVLRDGAVMGTTPLALALDADALRERPAELSLHLRGYVPHTWQQGPSSADLAVHRDLVRIVRPRRPSPPPEPAGPRGGNLSIKTRR